LHSPGGVADSLRWNWVSSSRTQVHRSPRFYFFIIWWVQDITDSYSIYSSVFWVETFLFPIKREEARRQRKKGKMAFCWANLQLCWSQPVPGLPWVLPAIKTYFKGWLLKLV
jgi:hypothetical protein